MVKFGLTLTLLASFLSAAAANAGELLNLSMRGYVADSMRMYGGLTVAGNEPQDVLIRVRGPSLYVGNPLSPPVVTLNKVAQGGERIEIAVVDGWIGQDRWMEISPNLQPTELNEPSLLVRLTPGTYGVVVSSADGDDGEVVVEIRNFGPLATDITEAEPPAPAGPGECPYDDQFLCDLASPIVIGR